MSASGRYLDKASTALGKFGKCMETDGKQFGDEALARVARAYFLAVTGIVALQMEFDGKDSSMHITISLDNKLNE